MKVGLDPVKLKEACGVFGIWAPGKDVARLTYFSLYSLQHRGQESAGIAVTAGDDIICYKDMGLVNIVFTEKILRLLKGRMAIGHVRYSTTGSSTEANAQPSVAGPNVKPVRKVRSGDNEKKVPKYFREVAVAHNGNLIDTRPLREELERQGVEFQATSDTEVIAEMIATSEKPTAEEAIIDTLRQLKGAFSLTMLCDGKLFAARDSFGVRPLCMGRYGSTGWVIASETCALNIIGAKFEREVRPGELVVIDDGKMNSIDYIESEREAICIFEFIYFARPDSNMLGRNLYTCRKNMGMILAREAPVTADVVISVPDSGTPAAIGFAKAADIPFEDGLIKNRYVYRTFIQPDQEMRDMGVKMKLNPLVDNIRGNRIVIVDDSIVRASTSSQIVDMLYNYGAKEVHVRVSSPPVKYPCFYGIDMAKREELIAATRSPEQIREKLKSKSLVYLSKEGLFEATGLDCGNFCSACFFGDYPIPVPPQQETFDKYLYENDRNGEVIVPMGLRDTLPRR